MKNVLYLPIQSIEMTGKENIHLKKEFEILSYYKEGTLLSFKHVQKIMNQLNLKSILIKKYRFQRSNKPIISKKESLTSGFF